MVTPWSRTTEHGPARSRTVLLNNGDGTFSGLTSTGVDGVQPGMAVEDFNGDATPDVAVTTGSAMIAVLLHV
jgi:hypothetical protein